MVFGPPGSASWYGSTLASWNPFSTIISRMTLATFFLSRLIHEAVEPDRDAELAQTLLDLRLLDRLGSLVVDRVLDPLPLFHVVHDDLADDAVRKRKVDGLDLQIVQEVGGPEPFVVADDRLFGGLVVRLPDVL
jgi:hypothetical protein